MRRFAWLIVALALLAAPFLAAPAPAAAQQGLLTAGVEVHDGSTVPWVSLNFQPSETGRFGVEYMENRLWLTVGYGRTSGFLGAVSVADGNLGWGLGLWTSFRVTPTVTGSLSVTAENTFEGGNPVQFRAGTNVTIPLGERLFVLVGAEAKFIEDTSKVYGLAGLGVRL